MNVQTKKWKTEQLIEAVKESFSMRQTLKKLGLVPTGQNYRLIPKEIKRLELDTSHFLGRGHLKNKNHSWGKKIALSEILIENSSCSSSHRLKLRLVDEGLLTYSCFGCGINSWSSKIVTSSNQKLSLQLDHINGVNTDNRIENLRLLCPNCHSLTNTYAGKNKKSEVENRKKKKYTKKDLCFCGAQKSIDAIACRTCSPPPLKTKIKWPSDEELLVKVKEQGELKMSEVLNCSSSSIRKRIARISKNSTSYCSCGKEKFFNAVLCRSCQGINVNKTKIDWPSEKELIQMIKNSSYLTVGKKLGVSDNAIRKRLKNRGYNLTEINKEQ
jgi:5-methylcytosine-specific restriction endonuclease McrA